jgi:hypothetical protein
MLVDVTLGAGSSGGTAINTRGELVGIAVSATHIDCRSSERVFAKECMPSGGSVAKLVPIPLVRNVLAKSEFADRLLAATP